MTAVVPEPKRAGWAPDDGLGGGETWDAGGLCPPMTRVIPTTSPRMRGRNRDAGMNPPGD
jgi:hypothetical protein